MAYRPGRWPRWLASRCSSQLSPLLTLTKAGLYSWLQPTNTHAFAYTDDPVQQGWFYTFYQFPWFSGSMFGGPTGPQPGRISPTAQNALVLLDGYYATTGTGFAANWQSLHGSRRPASLRSVSCWHATAD